MCNHREYLRRSAAKQRSIAWLAASAMEWMVVDLCSLRNRKTCIRGHSGSRIKLLGTSGANTAERRPLLDTVWPITLLYADIPHGISAAPRSETLRRRDHVLQLSRSLRSCDHDRLRGSDGGYAGDNEETFLFACKLLLRRILH